MNKNAGNTTDSDWASSSSVGGDCFSGLYWCHDPGYVRSGAHSMEAGWELN